MYAYSLFSDFQKYLDENEKIINFLNDNNSILNEFVLPIIKTLSYLDKLAKENDEGLSKSDYQIFEFGIEYLFEKNEQIKLYLKQFNNSYDLLEKMSLYIKIIFNLEEYIVELKKEINYDKKEIENDLNLINDCIRFFEDYINNKDNMDSNLDEFLNNYYYIRNKYNDITLIADAFIRYCNNYGI